jgi:ribosomal protein L37AE/L43A
MKSIQFYIGLAERLGQPETVDILASQYQQRAIQDTITCPTCERDWSEAYMTHCYYCGVWYCDACGEQHYGRTMAEHEAQEKAKAQPTDSDSAEELLPVTSCRKGLQLYSSPSTSELASQPELSREQTPPPSEQLELPLTDEERAASWKSLSTLHRANRFRLMFGQPLLTDERVSASTPPPVAR